MKGLLAWTAQWVASKNGAITVCPLCGEAHDAAQGKPCLACRGKGYWEALKTPVADAENG